MDQAWHDAHIRATSWISLNMKENILTDPEIPDELRNRIWSFVNGDLGVDPNTLPGDTVEWYKDKPTDSNWARYCDLLNRKQWDDTVIQSIEKSTRRAMNFLFNPLSESVESKYGLIVGHVQSGKTANYTGLIARAADSGYNVIIVLAGLHNNLRKQTQIRLERELMGIDKGGLHVNRPEGPEWYPITTQEDDFQVMTNSGFLSGNNPVIAVVKKNVSPLTKLYEMLYGFSEEKRCKLNLLMIDDESDHATINTKNNPDLNPDFSEYDDYDDDEKDDEITNATIINTRLRQIIGLFPRSAYVGYTATPFANVLIDPEGDHDSLGKTLYPRDFIMALPKPEGHMGLNEFFPDDIEMNHTHASQVTIVPPGEAEELRNYENDDSSISDFDIPNSLEDAIIDYLLSGAARICRGHTDFHHSMLIHTKHTIRNQSPVADKVTALTEYWNNHIVNQYSSEGSILRDRFESRWNEQFSTHALTEETWGEIEPCLMKFIQGKYIVMEINSNSEHDLDYDSHQNGLKVIAVGGNRLSRGLTLEGLSSTFFIRESRMYDTLTQMGRWFGFRPGYADLVRLHITPTLLEWFTWLTGVEKELRSDIERYADTGLKPDALAVRILKHRKMLPTSRAKMRSAKAFSPGLGASSPRTKKFTLDSLSKLQSNLRTIGELLSNLGDYEANNAGVLWRNVNPDQIISMLQAYHSNENDNAFNKIDIISHINRRVEAGELSSWSIGLIDNSKGKVLSPFSAYGFEHKFGLTTRSRLKGRESIGELMQPIHFAMDLQGELSNYRDGVSFSYSKMYNARDANNPLMLIYTIDKDSEISTQARQAREKLFTVEQDNEHVIGLAIAFPETNESEEERRLYSTDFWALGGVKHEPDNEPETDR
jgi:hypothetical protein